MFLIKLDKQVIKFLNKTDKKLSDRIKKKLKLLKINPFHLLEHFEGESFYKLRIGEYRTLIDIDFKNKIIYIRLLEHRKKIYKN